tara:strand:- start:1351 stop:1674 length:324 start_codon:yes stop_codon:yes gene_type:complete
MGRKKKLKIGDIVKAYFLGSSCRCEVIQVIDKNSYKLKQVDGTILPGVKWKKDMDKKSPWYIDAYLGHNDVAKSTEDQYTSKNTTDKVELEKAIKKQRKFVKGNINK